MAQHGEDQWLGKVAVVGMSCRLPGASDLREYWSNLRAGLESIDRFPSDEAAHNRFGRQIGAHTDFVGAEATIPGVDEFDHELFGYSLGEAKRLDPQLRISLQCAHEALDDAAHGGGSSDDAKIGVFFSASMSTYVLQYLLGKDLGAGADGLSTLLGNDKDHIATSIAYRLGLTGPAVSLGSGCSSSAAAIHYACLSLSTYQCDVAVAGGASIIFPQRQGHVYHQGGVYSKDGHCRPFSSDASGTVGGSGVGVVVLKRLEDAMRDNDDVYCVISGSACVNDGKRKIGYTAPSVAGQVETILAALAAADAEPSRFAYVEAHGTGTPLGDPIEVKALTEAFGSGDGRMQYCALGSVKANIGHLDSASGVAGLIKAALCVHHRERVPQISFADGHPLVPWDETPFFVATAGGQLFHEPGARFVGVNSLGMGGTNVFLVIEPAPLTVQVAEPPARTELIVLSAHRPDALLDNVRSLSRFVAETRPNLTDLAYTLGVCRARLEHRVAFLCKDTCELLRHLQRQLDAGEANRPVPPAEAHPDHPELEAMRTAWLAGQPVDWSACFPQQAKRKRLRLPAYAYRRTRCWIEPAVAHPAFERAVAVLAEQVRYPAESRARRDAQAEIDHYCICLMRDFLRERGLGCNAGDAYGHDEWKARLGLTAAFDKFGEYLIQALSDRGYLAVEPTGVAFVKEIVPSDTSAVAEDLLRRHPDYTPLIRLLSTVAAHRSATVCEERPALQGIGELGLEAIAAAIACDRDRSDIIRDFFRRVDVFLRELRLQAGRPLRVLEIGCGHLALTDHLLNQHDTDHLAEYWVTDADRQLAAQAKATYGYLSSSPRACKLHFATLDIDRSPGMQGIPEGHFDVVLGFNVLHVAKDVRRALSKLSGLLRAEGMFCQIDTVDSFSSTQLIWGMLPGWWAYADERANGPLLSAALYRGVLEETCDRYALFPDREDEGRAESVLWLASPKRQAAPAAAPQPATSSGSLTYVPAWRRLMDVTAHRRNAGEVTLLFHDDPRIGELFEALDPEGKAIRVPVIPARYAGQPGMAGEVVEPGDADAMHRLVEAVHRRYRRIDRVVFAWGAPPLRENAAAALAATLGTLHALASALDAVTRGEPVEWLLVSRGLYRIAGNEEVLPEGSMAFDMLRMIVLEYPQFRLRHVEFPVDGYPAPALLETASTAEIDDDTVAIRGHYLWRPTHEPVLLSPTGEGPDLNGAVIVMVGGLGGLGLEIAHQLVRRYRLHIVIIHRAAWLDETGATVGDADAPERRRVRSSLADLAAHALSLQLEHADVNDREAVHAAAARIGRRHPKVDGVLYLMGEIDRHGMLRKRTFAQLDRSVRTKTTGLVNASDALASLHPGFQVCFSSLGAVLHKAKFGEAGYVVGNGFMNAFARAVGTPTNKMICINWTDWRTQGMWANAQAVFRERYSVAAGMAADPARPFQSEHWLDSISAEDGVDLLLRIIGHGHMEVAVCAQDLGMLLDYQRHATHADYGFYLDSLDLKAAARSGQDVEPARFGDGTTERVLAEMWEDLLGIPVRNEDDNFYAAGGDSLLLLRLAARVKSVFGADLPLSALTDVSTFAGLVSLVERKMGTAGEARGTGEMTIEI